MILWMNISLLMINVCQLPLHTDLEVLQMVRKFDLMNLVANLSFAKEKLKFPVALELTFSRLMTYIYIYVVPHR